jgi:signal transduction histidine kinase/DNA-binding response OmpR family regulator
MAPVLPPAQGHRRVLLGWALTAVASVIVCWVLYSRDLRQLQLTNLERESSRSLVFGNIFDGDFKSTAADLRVLADSDNLHDAIRDGRPEQWSRIGRDILHRLQQEPEYDQIRFMDAAGHERVRVERVRGIIPVNQLVDKSSTPYFQAGMAAPRGAILISPLQLRRTGQSVESGNISILRFSMPIYDPQGRRTGVLAINYLGSALFSHFGMLPVATQRHIRVLNAQGYWLKAMNPQDEWGFEFPEKMDRTLAKSAPELWAQVIAKREGQLPYGGGWFTWHRIDPYATLGQKSVPGSFLIAASELPADEWAETIHGRAQPYLVVGAILLVVIATGAWIHDARIRERKKTVDALRRASDSAQEASRLKSQFLANMSHEIRTPMNGVVGMTGLLLDTPLSAEQRGYATTVRSSADALLSLINDILDFSKIEAGQLEFEQRAFDLRDPVENCLGLVAEKAHAKNLELAYLIEENVPTSLVGDSNRLHQVLLNLLGNAVKFTSAGEVVLKIAKVSESAGRARLRFTVRDTGTGVSPEVASRLFQPFVQGDSSTSRKFGGTGLGLAICKQLVTLMSGEISVESPPGGGASFSFTAEFPLSEAAPRIVPRKADLTGLRALIVDDNETNREILSRQLASWNLETRTAPNAEEALTVLRAAAAAGKPFQFAVLDMQMPGMSGLDAARAVGDEPGLAGLRKIILTSVGNLISRSVLEAAGVSACLSKPARQSQLHDALVEAFVGAHSPVAALEPKPAFPGASAPGAEADVKLRILVAEDNLVNQHVARLQLEKFGYRPAIVPGGREAVAAVKEGRYDVVLMDCQMPEVDGFEATRRIREWESERRTAGDATRAVHIIAMTANAMSGDRETCIAAGMNDYVTKPVRAPALAAALARAPGSDAGL